MPKPSLLALYRRRWTDADARIVLAALDASGLSVPTFAGREGLDPQRLYFWRRRIEATSEGARTPPPFVELEHRAPTRVEVVLRSGHVLRVVESIDGACLRRLVDALEQDAAC